MAAAGPCRRELPTERSCRPAPARRLLATLARPCPESSSSRGRRSRPVRTGCRRFCQVIGPDDPLRSFPLIVIVDDSEFAARTERQLLVGDLHAIEPRGRHRRRGRISLSRSTGAAMGRWSSMRGSSRTMPRRSLTTPRSSAGSMPWPRPADRSMASSDPVRSHQDV